MRGRGTAETEEASAHENARVTLETIRHAAVANLRNPPRGCEDIIRSHFRALRNRILRRCKRAVDEAPDDRLKRATLRASTELRAEMDKLLAAHTLNEQHDDSSEKETRDDGQQGEKEH